MPEITMKGDLVGQSVWVIGEGSRVELILKWLKSAFRASNFTIVVNVELSHPSNKSLELHIGAVWWSSHFSCNWCGKHEKY